MGRKEHSDRRQRRGGKEKNKELCFCGGGCKQVPFSVRNQVQTKRDIGSGPGASITEHN